MLVQLNQGEVAALFEQDPSTARDGGFQGLLVKVQGGTKNGVAELDQGDLERIPRYAFDYRNGGWQDRLLRIFGRALGPRLGRT